MNPSTFRFLAASHPVVTSREGRYVEFNFQNINLPDSGSDEPGSHGFVRYSVSPNSNLISGTDVKNTAYIYFDQNPSVVTNTEVTEYVAQFSNGICSCDEKDARLIVAPNPSRDNFNIYFNNPERKQYAIEMFDLAGRIIKQQYSNEGIVTLSNTGLSPGMYFLELRGDKIYKAKVMIE